MIRVAVIMGKMHSGGKKNLVMEYYRNIDRSKVQFDFICDKDSNAIPKEEIEKLGGKVYIVEPYQNLFANMLETYKILKKGKYDIVHGYNNTVNVFSMYVAKKAGISVRINESISMAADKGDWKTYFKNILKPTNKLFATHYMANGEECGIWQFGEKLFKQGKIKIFKTVINAEKNEYDITLRNKTRKEFNIENDLVIGHIGRITEQKNTLFLIDIFNEIQKIYSNSKLLLVGDGNLKKEMLNKINDLGIKDKVIYLGRTEDIHKLYNAMDCFVLPSLYEGLPVVGVEAECCGLPVFFSSVIPNESSVCDDLGTFIGLDQNSKKWAEIIVNKTLENIDSRKDRIEDIKKAGFDSVKEAGLLLNYYEQIIRETNGYKSK